jgi:AraC-like DNA-binding protein
VRYLETRPSADLAPYVQCLWELEDCTGTALAEPIFPDGRVEIVIHLGDRPVMANGLSAQPDVIVVGQMTSAVRLQPVTRLHAVGVRFTPTGARSWFEAPLHELTDRVAAMEDISRVTAMKLRDAVHQVPTPQERVRRIERVLRTALRTVLTAPRSIEHAVHLTLAHSGRLTVDALARACNASTRQLERQYLQIVGLTPKAFARTVRFQRALRDLQRGVPAAEAAAIGGFADQAHLAREFRRFAGASARQVDLAHVAFLQDHAPRAGAD